MASWGSSPSARSPLDLSYNVMSGDLAPLPTSTLALHAANLLRGAPPDLAVLLALIALNASNNSLSNPLKPDLYTNALTLRVLNISVNRLAGSLPSAPPPCTTALRELSLTSNAFIGALPAVLFTLTGIHKLSLASNALTG
jgi:hypothetical protein